MITKEHPFGSCGGNGSWLTDDDLKPPPEDRTRYNVRKMIARGIKRLEKLTRLQCANS